MMSEENVRLSDEDYGAYYARLLSLSYRASEAVKIHETWKRRLMMGSGVREVDCKQRLLVVLRELLKSDFLRNDYIDTGVPKDDCERANQELRTLNFEELMEIEGADWKYALLSQQMRKPEEKRLLVDDNRAGFYIDEMHEKLSDEDVEVFLWFATLTRLAYQEIDQLKKENRDHELKKCIIRMQADLKPLCEYVVPAYEKAYDVMLDEILQVGDLQKKLKRVSPNTFKGDYNQKLTCNLVGLLCGEDVYNVNPKQADVLIYTGKTHYTYINNYANFGTSDSELTREDVNAIREIIKKYI